MLPSGVKEQAPFEENALSEWMRNERISLDYRDKTPKLQRTFVSAYLQSRMIPEYHLASVFFTAADVKLLCDVVSR